MDDPKRISAALDRIDDYCSRIPRMIHRFGRLDALKEDQDYQMAAVMALSQIGENVKLIQDWLYSNSPDYDWTGCIRFRDLVSHHYHVTDFDEVWGIMNDDVPKLWDEIHRLQDVAGNQSRPRCDDNGRIR